MFIGLPVNAEFCQRRSFFSYPSPSLSQVSDHSLILEQSVKALEEDGIDAERNFPKTNEKIRNEARNEGKTKLRDESVSQVRFLI